MRTNPWHFESRGNQVSTLARDLDSSRSDAGSRPCAIVMTWGRSIRGGGNQACNLDGDGHPAGSLACRPGRQGASSCRAVMTTQAMVTACWRSFRTGGNQVSKPAREATRDRGNQVPTGTPDTISSHSAAVTTQGAIATPCWRSLRAVGNQVSTRPAHSQLGRPGASSRHSPGSAGRLRGALRACGRTGPACGSLNSGRVAGPVHHHEES